MKKINSIIKNFVKEHLFEQKVKQFQMSLPSDLIVLSNAFKREKKPLYVVGGAVRDAIQGKTPKDYDVATSATPEQIITIIKMLPQGHKIIEIGKAFGVINVITPQGNEYEIATFRKDVGAGRRPDSVEFTSIEKDVLRRDLTINALFYDIDQGVVVDYVGGIEDIENNVVRTVGDPNLRFGEDRLRILRALRFASRLNSNLDPMTSKAIKSDNSLTGVSHERIRDEFLKGVSGTQKPSFFIDLIDEFDLWSQIFPKLHITSWAITTTNKIVLLAVLLHENDPELLAKQLGNLKYTLIEIAQIKFLTLFKKLNIENAYTLKKLFLTSHLSDSDLIEYSNEIGRPNKNLLNAFIKYKPSIKGNQLISQGFKGQELGKELVRQETERFKEIL